MLTARAAAAERLALAGALAGELRYSRVWEDHLLLERGLAVAPHDDLLIVASAGCNVLNLLLHEPRRVVAIDLNPAQTALVHLKLAGIRTLRRREFLELLGATPGCPLARYAQVRHALPGDARAWWDANGELLAGGVERAGRLDRFIARFQREHLARILAPDVVGRMLGIADRRERARFARAELFTPAFERAFRAYFTREALDARGRHPSQSRHVDVGDVAGWLLGRLQWACTGLPVDGNFYLERFLRAEGEAPLWRPPYLAPAAYERLRALVGRVEVVTAELGDYLVAQPPGRFSKAALSDLFEYLSEESSDDLFAALQRALRDGGRLAYWNLFVPRSSPAALRGRVRPLERLSRALGRRDRAWFYRSFHVEEVLPT